MDERTARYAETLAAMIRRETVSVREERDTAKFEAFRDFLAELFPHIFAACEVKRFPNALALRWKGAGSDKRPVLFMNHHDVVEVTDGWTHAPFSGDVADGKLWGRGTLDDKGGLWGMLQAADELAAEGFVPPRDVWFSSTSTEETAGSGASEVVAWFREQGIRFEFTLDEGGMIVYEPIDGAKGSFAMIGVGEKGVADLRFVARSNGGHASAPGKNTPLVRLGKFMAAVENSHIFTVELAPPIREMFRRLAPSMGKLGKVLAEPDKFAPLLKQALPRLSGTAAALVRTTVAFTMAQGSAGANVLPREAWVVGNMRFSHHQGQQASFRAIEKLAKRYDVEMEIIDPGFATRLADYNGAAFRLTEQAVRAVFPDVTPTPYIMTGASDSRFYDEISDACIRFVPFRIDRRQMNSIHGVDENVDLSTLAPAVDWYRWLMQAL